MTQNDPDAAAEPMHEGQVLDNQVYERLTRQMPRDILTTFTPVQLAALENGLKQKTGRHRIDFRVSLPWFGRRHYIALLVGRENRSIERLQREGQVAIGRVAGTYGAALFLIGGLMLVSASIFVYSISKMIDSEGATHMTYLRTRP